MLNILTLEDWLDLYSKKIYVIRKLKEFEQSLYNSGKLIKNKEEIGIEEFEVLNFLFSFKIFKIEKGNIPIKIEIGEIKLSKDERLCYCIDENYLEEFEKAFKI